ncbi:MAG: dihydropteroate synthase [Bacteroidales bacterium 45-6]|nr:MAG: dihydropteroate synthase [Bacteroidales bacterium 45-6]
MEQTKTINIRGELLDLSQPLVMGIANITPDSFFDKSRKQSEIEAVEHVGKMIAQGASIIDIGAQSSNPKSPLISVEEESERLRKVLPTLTKEFPKALFSIDTFYSQVAKMCVEEFGVGIVNDISGGQMDEDMFGTVAQLKVPYILMHMKGTPQTMTQETHYKHLTQDIFFYFSKKIETLKLLGLNDILIDPGFGFSKTLNQNYELMAQLRNFHIFGLPLLVGISRKSMIYHFLETTPQESLNATTALNMYALQHGASILRVHDVKEAVETIKLFRKLQLSEPIT